MNNALAIVIARSGLLEESQLEEFRRWGLPVEPVGARPMTLASLVTALNEALEGEDLMLTRLTDFEVLEQYLKTQKVGKLHLALSADGEEADIDVTFGKTLLGEYIVPWNAESILEELANGRTYIKDMNTKVYFADAREVFFGDRKAFVLCTPVKDASSGHD